MTPSHFQANPLRSLPWQRLGFAMFALCMASACAQSPGPIAAAPASHPAKGATAFAGRWAYVQSCGWQHSAELEFETTADGIRGTWNDGTRVRGESGELRGSLRDGRVFVRFCREADGKGADVCPDFGPEQAYVVRKDERLIWYRSDGAAAYRKYLTLHPVVAGAEIPTDDDCPDDEAAP